MTSLNEVFIIKEIAHSLSLSDEEVEVLNTALRAMIDNDVMGAGSGKVGKVNLHALTLKLKPQSKKSAFGNSMES